VHKRRLRCDFQDNALTGSLASRWRSSTFMFSLDTNYMDVGKQETIRLLSEIAFTLTTPSLESQNAGRSTRRE
jgi:hypothetical protein